LESALEQPEVIETEVKAKEELEVKKELPPESKKPYQEELTRLGRHLKSFEERLDRFGNLDQKLDEVLSRFDRPSREEVASEEVDEVIATAADVRRIARADRIKEEQERARDQGQYEQNYIRTLRNFERDNPTLHQEIFKEMMTNFNVRRSNSPSLDADLNYTKAKSAVLAKKISAVNPQPKVAGAKTTASTDLSIESRDIATGAKEIKLDEFAESFRKSSGMSDESVRQAVGKK
jgi:hypothetical protein